MKKVFFTLALALGFMLSASAQEGLFGYGPSRGGGEDYSTNYNERGGLLNLPGQHGLEDDQSPLGTGTALLLGLGAAYLATKKRKNQKNPKHHNAQFFLMAAALTAGLISAQPTKVMGQAPVNTTLWEETWGTFSSPVTPSAYDFNGTTVYGGATLTYAQSSTNTKLYDQALAGGTTPELLLSKSNQTWTISNIPTGQATKMSLTFLSNKTTFAVTSTTTGISISGSQKSWTIEATSSVSNFNLTIKNTGGDNARIDNIVLKVTTAGGSSTTTPTTVTIDDTNLTNTDVYQGTAAGTLTATVTENTNNTAISGATVTWESTNTNVATITDAGVVTLVAAGTTTIKANYAGDATYGASSASYNLEVTDSTPFTGSIFVFNTDAGLNALGITKPDSGAGTDLDASADYTLDNVTMNITHPTSGTKTRVWNSSGVTDLRVYSGGSLIFSVPNGYLITKVSFAGSAPFSNWSGTPAQSVTFSASGTMKINTITVEYETDDSPSCTINPTAWDFGNVGVGQTVTKDFTVSTANLEHDLTLSFYMSEAAYSVSPTTIASSATSTTVTVTCIPNALEKIEDILLISGDDFEDDIEVSLAVTGTYNAPANALAYTTPLELTLENGEAETTLTPTANTGNGGTITYAITQGDTGHAQLDNTGYFYADATGTWVVTATQADNATNFTSGGTFDITINVVSTDPYCTITPENWDFGYVALGTSATKTFTVTTGNLTGDLTVAIASDASSSFSVQPTTIAQNATSTEVTVTYTPTAIDEVIAALTITGGGLASAADAVVTGGLVILTVEEAQSTTQNNVYVQGIISQIDEVSTSFHNATYYISDDGTQTGQLYVFRGKYLNNADFTATDQIKIGDEVVVYGNLIDHTSGSTTTHEFAQGNYLFSLNRPVNQYDLTVNTIQYLELFVYVGGDETQPALEGAGTIQVNNDTEVAISISANEGYVISSLVVDGTNVTSQIDETGEYTFTMPAHNITITAMAEVAPTPGIWVLTDFADLTPADVFVIVGTYNNKKYALSNNNGTSAPLAVEVTLDSENTNQLSANPANTLQWTLVGNPTDGYIFYPKGVTDNYLYCGTTANTSSNNNIKVGTGNTGRNRFVLGTNDNNYYLITNDDYVDRYVCVFDATDWRGYIQTSITSNNKNITNTSFYRKVSDPVTITTSISAYTPDANPIDGWYLITPPVASATPTDDNGFLTNTYDLYRFNPTSDKEWENHRIHNFNLESGKGYLYANSEEVILSFNGQPYNGNGIVPLIYYVEDDEFNSLNLIGNPFKTAAALDNTHDFYVINSDRTEIITGTNRNIDAMEGVFVVANSASDKVIFTKGETSNAPSNNKQSVIVNVAHNRSGVIDRAIVRFNGNDNLPKFQLFENSTKLYIAQDGKDYAIVGSEAQGEMPVCFKANADGQYTISVDAENVEMNYLHLIDNIAGTDIDLLATPSYTFNAKWDDYASRFRLVFSAINNDAFNGESDDFAFISNGQIILNGVNNNATLQVIDMMGRIVSSEQINGNSATLAPTASGVYVLRLINGNETKTQKIVVK